MEKAYLFEFIGTLVLVLFGDGVCAACSLNKSKAKGGGWVVIALAWGLAVMMGVLVAGPVSGAHLNPAVTLGLAIAGKFAWRQVLGYIVAQMLGGFVGALLVYVFYKDHYKATSDEPDTMLGTFCTMPAIWNPWRNFLSEFIATTLLVFIILAIGFEGNAFQVGPVAASTGAIGAWPVTCLICWAPAWPPASSCWSSKRPYTQKKPGAPSCSGLFSWNRPYQSLSPKARSPASPRPGTM